MQGTDNGFEPESNMTRAMLVTILFRLEESTGIKSENTFTDVPENTWYTDAVIWAKECGIVTGVTETEFAPDDNITREQLVTVLFRYAKFKGCDTSDFESLDGFTDAAEISVFAVDAFGWAYKNLLINGTSSTLLSPKNTATRAQVATILTRFCNEVYAK